MFRRDPSAEDIMAEGFYSLPSERTRRRMTPMKLAELLSEQKPGSVQYILVEHELNIRIAKVQSNATYWGAALTLIGVVVGWYLQELSKSPPPPIDPTERGAKQYQHGPVAPPEPPASSFVVAPSKAVHQPHQSQKTASQRHVPQHAVPPRKTAP